ncbi:hypothetical protein ABIA31_002895 [Catenulispora sp. MAP5-51]|uniref:hypothetical protein n=1 Tax=Catenulispora sp. MAP5-51 TaxID=3156298 RepID=UPI0035182C5E
MTEEPPGNAADSAMLAWLGGDDTVTDAANRIWDAAGEVIDATAALHAAQRNLEVATDAYSVAVRGSRIPAADAERIGAAFILRIGRSRIA